ncbi:J domain-containing protein [Pelagibacteraceae bacterium]|nr:J domain-containing protein [Pelagibacteraceae bacterium]
MNLFLLGIIIFVIVYLFLHWFAQTSSKKIATTIKKIAVYLSLALAAIFTLGGKYLLSLPFLFVILSGLKIKGLTALQFMQLWRLINFLKNSGKFSKNQFGKVQGSSNISNDEAYKLLGLLKGCSKQEVETAAAKLQKKIHPDLNRDIKTERLSQLVNEAKDKILKEDFS